MSRRAASADSSAGSGEDVGEVEYPDAAERFVLHAHTPWGHQEGARCRSSGGRAERMVEPSLGHPRGGLLQVGREGCHPFRREAQRGPLSASAATTAPERPVTGAATADRPSSRSPWLTAYPSRRATAAHFRSVSNGRRPQASGADAGEQRVRRVAEQDLGRAPAHSGSSSPTWTTWRSGRGDPAGRHTPGRCRAARTGSPSPDAWRRVRASAPASRAAAASFAGPDRPSATAPARRRTRPRWPTAARCARACAPGGAPWSSAGRSPP